MRSEAPQFKRCCFCVPLRRGLIGWGYCKLVLNVLTFAYIILLCSLIRRYGVLRFKDIAIFIVVIAIVITDTCFNIGLVVAGHRKSVKLLRVSYIYNLVSLSLVMLAHCFKIYTNLYNIYWMTQYMGFHMFFIVDLMVCAALAFGVIFVQVYMILLIRSEMIKLQNQSLEIQFSNHLAGEPQCTLHNTSEQCTEEKRAVQNCCTDKQALQNCCTDKKQAVQNCCTDKQAQQNCCTDKNQLGKSCCTDEKVLDSLMLSYAALMFYLLAVHGPGLFSSDIVIYTITGACLFIDISFNIVFIVAGHKKSVKLLKLSYVYHMVWVGLLTLGTCLMLYADIDFIQRIWPYMKDSKYIILELSGSGLGISLIFVQIYVILLTRSEIRKLQIQTLEMQFTNHVAAGEPLCTLHNESAQTRKTNHCTDKKNIVQAVCTD
ncbi:uncharacterized protein LOC134747952 [Cydia strobilella]|uniref:uncharacterized protein LOC134747952 n=1 Tax=Cydia strobilella TaxID=1100964 RepID=UPI003006F51E